MAEGGLGSARAGTEPAKKAAAVMPVVDDSEFGGLDGGPGGPEETGPKKKKPIDSLMEAADRFATKAERSRRRSKSSAIMVEDDFQGLSLEDDLGTDLSAGMMARARTGKTDVSLEGRLTKWAAETKELILNPTPIQVTYGVIFGASVLFLILIGVFAFSIGAVRLRGDGLDVERRRQFAMQDPYTVRRSQMADYKRRALEAEDLRSVPFLDDGTGRVLRPPPGEEPPEAPTGTRMMPIFGSPPLEEDAP